MVKISFSPNEQNFHVPEGSELKELADLPLTFGCRQGGCGVCAIQVIEGKKNLTKISKDEKKTLLKKGLSDKDYRLACQCALNGDVIIQQPSINTNSRK